MEMMMIGALVSMAPRRLQPAADRASAATTKSRRKGMELGASKAGLALDHSPERIGLQLSARTALTRPLATLPPLTRGEGRSNETRRFAMPYLREPFSHLRGEGAEGG